MTPGGIRWGLKDFRQLVACGLGVGSSPDSWWMSLADRTLKVQLRSPFGQLVASGLGISSADHVIRRQLVAVFASWWIAA